MYLHLSFWETRFISIFWFVGFYQIHFSFLETCKLIFPRETGFVNGIFCVLIFVRKNLIYPDVVFIKLVVFWFILSWNLIYFDFFLIVKWCLFFSSKTMMHFWFLLVKTFCMLIISSRKLIYLKLVYLKLKLVACWFLSLWKFYIDFSCETSFVRGTCCVLILVRDT